MFVDRQSGFKRDAVCTEKAAGSTTIMRVLIGIPPTRGRHIGMRQIAAPPLTMNC